MTSSEHRQANAPVVGPDLTPFSAENNTTFRLARLLLLLDVAKKDGRRVASLDRLGYYDFFADNPFIVIEDDKPRDAADRATLQMSGFNPGQLGYASSGQRFLSRRRRLQHDFARLVAYGLATLSADGYVVTGVGAELAKEFRTVYADAYRESATIVLRRLVPLSNKRLEIKVEHWVGHSWLLLDLLEDVNNAEAPTQPVVPAVVEVPVNKEEVAT